MSLPRRLVLVLLATTVLAGCGFKLRTSQALPFATIAVTPEKTAGVAGDISRYLGDRVRPVAPGAGGELPEVILDISQEAREKLVVGVNASGQVREYELRMRITFSLRSPKGGELIAPSFIEQHRSISFNESAVLAKEAEEVLLYRDMQNDIVQQLLRRLAAFKPANVAPLTAPTTPAPASE
jgi:LPS-assembly lipoprotein